MDNRTNDDKVFEDLEQECIRADQLIAEYHEDRAREMHELHQQSLDWLEDRRNRFV